MLFRKIWGSTGFDCRCAEGEARRGTSGLVKTFGLNLNADNANYNTNAQFAYAA